MEKSVFIEPIQKTIYKIVFKNPLIPPVLIENEDQFKDFVKKLKNQGEQQLAREVTEEWVALKNEHFKINYKGKFINLGYKTAVMGILNVTPDSFSDGGTVYQNIDKAVEKTAEMLEHGADIIDIGGESTRPGAEPITVEEEMERVIPVIKAIRKELGNNFFISIDTYKSQVAKAALDEGADIVNDISGLTFDIKMADLIAEYDCPVIINHIKGTPKTMQKQEIYYDDVIKEITDFLENQIQYGMKHGIRKDRFIIDPGIGFGKNIEHNIEIIKRLDELKILGRPILIGISRKSFIGIILKNLLSRNEAPKPTERVYGSLAATAVAVENGAKIVRTHDVKATTEFLTILDTIRGYRIV